MSLTPAQVHNVAFSKPPRGKRGYNEDEVDAFLDRVEAALQNPTGRILTAEQVHNVSFSKPPIGKRGSTPSKSTRLCSSLSSNCELRGRSDLERWGVVCGGGAG